MFPQFPGTSSASDIRSIAFVDSGISDADSLIEGLSDHHVIQLPVETNGIEAITQALSQYQNLGSIHVFSHGENGSLQLGNASLSQAFLSNYKTELESWGDALTGTGDLLFYGCNFAAGGEQFIEQISQATGADVAASNDLTGQGGDWDLEVAVGSIETAVALTQTAQATYEGTLALLSNGDFEQNLSGWSPFTGTETVSTAESFSGNASLQLSAAGSGVNQTMDVLVGESYTFTGNAKSSSSGYTAVGINFFDENYNFLDGASQVISVGDWEAFQLESTAVAGSRYVQFWAYKDTAAGDFFVDNLVADTDGVTPPPPPPPSGGTELLSNPGFESGLGSWSGFTGSESVSAAESFAGGSSLQLSNATSGTAQLLDTVVAGEEYTLSAYGKSSSTDYVGLGINFFDSNFNVLPGGVGERVTSTDWQSYQATTTAPTGASYIQVWTYKSDGTGDAFLDEISLTSGGTTPPPSDTTAPTASLSASNVSSAGNSYDFTVTYEDASAVDVSSLDGSDIRVTGPNGFSQAASLVSVSQNGDGTPRTATYRITPPGGDWAETDNGVYSVNLQATQVSDTLGNTLSSPTTLGSFEIEIAPESTPPTASLNASNVTTEGGSTYTFTVDYVDDSGINNSTLDNNDIQVVRTADGLTQNAELVTAINGIASYRITAPGGTWNPTDNGTYTVKLLANQVSDVNGNVMLPTTLGSFDVAIEGPLTRAFPTLINGSFEANPVDNDGWTPIAANSVPGWQSLNGESIEIWDSGHSGVASSDGSNHIELDYQGSNNLDGIYQDLQTVAGETYTLTFDIRARSGNLDSESEKVIVEWNGTSLNNSFQFTPKGDWTTVTTTIIGTGGSDRLTLKESDIAGASDGSGPFLDNIRIRGEERIVNGSFETNAVDNDQWATFDAADVAGWQSLNGERIEFWDSGHNGVTSSEGSNHIELDYVGGSNLDGIYQDISTYTGETYELTFDLRARAGALGSASETVVVEWNGTVVNNAQFTPNGDWTTVTATVIGTGNSDRIILRESEATGASDGLGPLLDNISLRAAAADTSNEFESPTPNGLGFTRETLVSGLDNPLAFTYADDGRIFVTEKAGRVKIIENGQVVSTFIDINAEVNSYWDRGLMGIALDPDFENNGWVYLSYVVDLEPATPDRPDFGSRASGRLIRVKVSDTNANVADLSTREVILDGHKMTHATHAVGDVDFDNDGNLIFSWGDGGFGDDLRFEAQDPDSKQGNVES